MRATLAALATLVVVAAVYLVIRPEQQRPAPTVIAADAPPVRGWKPLSSRTFALTPGESGRWDISAKGKLRLSVAAQSPVSFKMDIGGCEASHVLTATEECRISPPPAPTLLIADTRDPGASLITAVVGTYAKSSSTIERSTAPNRVTVELFEWTCIQNCR
jgi:hypothetical protein